jgi:hypothetical protein
MCAHLSLDGRQKRRGEWLRLHDGRRGHKRAAVVRVRAAVVVAAAPALKKRTKKKRRKMQRNRRRRNQHRRPQYPPPCLPLCPPMCSLHQPQHTSPS